MLLTIDVKDSAFDKVLYILENLKKDVKIINRSLDIEVLTKDDEDYKHIISGRKERVKNPKDYGSLDDINWD